VRRFPLHRRGRERAGRVVGVQRDTDIDSVHAQFQGNNRAAGTQDHVSGDVAPMNRDAAAVEIRANHRGIGGRCGYGRVFVTEEADVTGDDNGPEAVAGGATDRDAVAGDQRQTGGCSNIHRVFGVLDEESLFIAAEIGDGGFKDGGQFARGVLMADRDHIVKRAQGSLGELA
jgi:hypothetical protein